MGTLQDISDQIKKYARDLGFDACGICKAEPIEEKYKDIYNEWLKKNFQSTMDYLARNVDKRLDPTLLVDETKSVISVVLNYYPRIKQDEEVPQFAYYAYGIDYHDVMKNKLTVLLEKIQELLSGSTGRYFCDTAPVLERYWAAKAGIGFIGKNTLLIMPKKGSYFFIGEILLDRDLSYDKPLELSCGKCTRCLDFCPTNAFESPYILNSQKCISYQTIENKGDIDPQLLSLLGSRVYGCDACQQICPWNRYSKPHYIKEFEPKQDFLKLDWNAIYTMDIETYRSIFKGSAVKRAKFSGLKRNFEAIRNKDPHR